MAASLGGCVAVDGLTGGTRDASAPNEAGQTADATGDSFAPSDAAQADGDAAPDVAARADANDSGSLCSVSGNAFCDTFDRANGPETGWSNIVQLGGSIALVTEANVSPPNALRVTRDPPADGDTYLERFVTTPAISRVRFEMDLDLETAPPNQEVDLVRLDWIAVPPPCSTFGFYFVRSAPNMLVLQPTFVNCTGGITTESLPNLAGFHHFALEIGIGQPGSMSVWVDHVLLVSKATQNVPSSGIRLRVGAMNTQVTSPWVVYYDNVSLVLE